MRWRFPPFTSTDREPFERGFAKAIRDGAGRQSAHCAPVTTEKDSWDCIEWTVVLKQVPLKSRAYLFGRGITKAVVLFTAPAEHFSVFGDPYRWLGDLECKGPSVACAI